MTKEIRQFRDKTYYLSNFYEIPVEYKNITYPHNEAAFQAQKTHDSSIRKIFTKLTPQEAKRLGKNIRLRRDWEEVKDEIMYEICLEKFKQNKDIQQKLIDTKDALLIEGNTWHDTYWGMCDNKGQNKLGKILMQVRDQLQ